MQPFQYPSHTRLRHNRGYGYQPNARGHISIIIACFITSRLPYDTYAVDKPLRCVMLGDGSSFVLCTHSCLIYFCSIKSDTYDHRVWRTGLPVRSAVLKPHAGRLVVGWVTTSESRLLYVVFIVLIYAFFSLPV